MIGNDQIIGKIDQSEGLVCFGANNNKTSVKKWDANILKTCSHINEIVDRISTKN